jgi:hypothetical protein
VASPLDHLGLPPNSPLLDRGYTCCQSGQMANFGYLAFVRTDYKETCVG